MNEDGKLTSITPYLEPVRKSISVACTPERAFAVFTGGMARWWPLKTYSLSQERAVTCAIEPHQGGVVYEVSDEGTRIPWGQVLVWDPPARLVLSWHPGNPPEAAQEVELRFTPTAGGTKVDLEHRGWERLGARGAQAREGYEGGWVLVFEQLFAQACANEEIA